MDPLSITTACFGLISTITRASLVVIGFVKNVRAARSDLDVVSRELISLKTILELLADDVNDSSNESIPQTLQKQIAGIVTNCTGVVVDIEKTLKKHEGGKVSKAAAWVTSGKKDVAKLQTSLEAHKSALEIALDMVTLTLARGIKADTQELHSDTSAIKQDTALILAEIARLQEQLPRDSDRNHTSGFILERYLDNLTSYAETVCDSFPDDVDDSKSNPCGFIDRERSASPTSYPGINEEDKREHMSNMRRAHEQSMRDLEQEQFRCELQLAEEKVRAQKWPRAFTTTPRSLAMARAGALTLNPSLMTQWAIYLVTGTAAKEENS